MSTRWLSWAVPVVMLLAGARVPGAVTLSRAPAHPVAAAQATPPPEVRTVDVPILMYHHVGNPRTYQTYSVDARMFQWQMDYLQLNGYHTVGPDDIAAALTSGAPLAPLPEKPIALTFDDGWVLQITNTLPVLAQHGFRATFYVIVNSTGRNVGNMNWDQVRQLRDAGMWVGSHTLSHGYLPGMSDARMHSELADSKQILERELGVVVTSLAYPGGSFNARVERVAQEAGYTTAVSVIGGYTQRADQLYRLRRVGVYGVDTQERFIAKVDGTFFQKSWPYPRGQARLPAETPVPSPTPLPSLVP